MVETELMMKRWVEASQYSLLTVMRIMDFGCKNSWWSALILGWGRNTRWGTVQEGKKVGGGWVCPVEQGFPTLGAGTGAGPLVIWYRTQWGKNVLQFSVIYFIPKKKNPVIFLYCFHSKTICQCFKQVKGHSDSADWSLGPWSFCRVQGKIPGC